jgi:uncharacterized protein YecE (DUF72 family)
VSRYWLGCSGWAYDDWVGPFYPPGTPPGEFLSQYAQVFRTVEVDSSFYRAPSPFLVRRWAERTPEEFRFALKVPRQVTHETDAARGEEVLGHFLESLRPLADRGKLAAVVLQFPPSFRAARGTDRLTALLAAVPRDVPLAVELRDGSWWTETTRRLLDERRAALVWSVVPETEPPAWVTGEFLYARFVGDRALTTFDRVQRGPGAAFTQMRRRFEEEGRDAGLIYGYANNHFMGFGPGTVEALATELGAPVPDLGRARRPPGQRTLPDGDASGSLSAPE